MERSVLASVLVIGVVAAMLGAGTMAYFSDTETVGVHDIQAGTLDLTVNDKNGVTIHYDIHNMKPGDLVPGPDQQWFIGWKLKNVGTITGQPWVEFSAITNHEHGIEEPEVGAAGEDETELGELGNYLLVRIGSQGHADDPGPLLKKLPPWQYPKRAGYGEPVPLNTYGGTTWLKPGCGRVLYGYGNTMEGWYTLSSGEEITFYICFILPSTVGNCIQGDSVEFDIIFHLDQA